MCEVFLFPTVREESRARNQESRAKRLIEYRRIENRQDSRLQTSDNRYQISDMLKRRDYILHIIIIKDQKVSQQMTKH